MVFIYTKQMNIEDFLPKYPNIQNSEEILNPYDDGFYESIFRKKEFYDERLEKIENIFADLLQ